MPQTGTVDDQQIIDIFEDSSDPAHFVSEISDVIGYTDEGARYRLDKLVDAGILCKKKGGYGSVVYWLKDSSGLATTKN